MFSSSNGIVVVGQLSDELSGPILNFKHAWNSWYYLHAEKISKQERKYIETVPLFDYLFRYDRGAFWVGRHAFEIFKMPFNGFTRWLFNSFLHTRKLYQALQESGASQQHIVQDLALPLNKAAGFMKFIDESTHIYPLWLCPLKTDNKSPFQSNNIKTPLVINIGVWGGVIKPYEKFIEVNKSIERKLSQLGGKKWFYAHSYYTEDEFWNNYDRKWYDSLRKKYRADSLPNIYEKIQVKQRYDINLKRGALKTMWGIAKIRITD